MDTNRSESRLSVSDWLVIYVIVLLTTIGAFLAIFCVVWFTLGLPAAAAMLAWLGTVINYGILVVPVFVGVYLLLRMTRRHDAEIIRGVSNAITRHDMVDALGDGYRRAMPGMLSGGMTGTDVARITESQNMLHRSFLEQVAQTARTMGEGKRSVLPVFPNGGNGDGYVDGDGGEEW